MPFVSAYLIPAAVFVAMLVVGLDLTAADFARVAQYPKTVVVGTLGQMTILPACAGVLAITMELEEPLIGGLVLIAAAPGAPISNLLAHLGRGNVALSVTLTAITNAIGILTFPFLAAGGIVLLLGQRTAVDVPAKAMFGQLFLVLLLPIALGMLWRHRRPAFVEGQLPRLRRLIWIIVALIIALVVADQRAVFLQNVGQVGLLAVLLTVLAMGAGVFVGIWLGRPLPDRVTLMIEFSTRNAALAVVAATAALGRPDYAVFVAAYFVVQMSITAPVLVVSRILVARQGGV